MLMPTTPRVARDLLLKPPCRLELHGPVQCVHQWIDMSQVGMLILEAGAWMTKSCFHANILILQQRLQFHGIKVQFTRDILVHKATSFLKQNFIFKAKVILADGSTGYTSKPALGYR